MSRPRPATSLQTRRLTSPSLNAASVSVRRCCTMSPCSARASKPWRWSEALTISTSFLRLQKISALCTASSRSRTRNATRFSSGSTRIIAWLTVPATVAGGATLTSLGLIRNSLPSFLISGPSVAENMRVWRMRGSVWTMRSTSGMKPMSSMRSASSITKTLTPPQHDPAALEHVDQATRGGDQNVGVLAERGLLQREPLPADEQRLAQAVFGAVSDEVVGNLLRELPRRRQDQAARHPRLARARAQDVDDRQRVGCGLARAGLGAAQQVDTAQDQRDGLLLDRRRRLVAGPRQRRRAAARSSRDPRILHSIPRNFLHSGDFAAPRESSSDSTARAPAWLPAACRGPMT